jgi:23S rRNA-/tRNA-specific pseudouridylate synthase
MDLPKILFQSADWIVSAKPSGWLVIAGRQLQVSVLREWVEKEVGEKIFVTHRIDQETSGLVLFARHADAHRQANEWFSKHEIKKNYDLLAGGKGPSAPLVRIAEPIKGAPSLTQLEVRERYGVHAFLGRAIPMSGRTHQIRIHLRSIGFPILGDDRYGGVGELALGAPLAVGRVALHAAKLELPSGEVFEAPWPEDFQHWVTRLREDGRESAQA